MRAFLLHNLIEDTSGFRWRIDLELFDKSLEYLVTNTGTDSKNTFEGQTLFIGGTASPYIHPEWQNTIYEFFPTAKLELIEDVGHYMHQHNPTEFLKVLSPFLKGETK